MPFNPFNVRHAILSQHLTTEANTEAIDEPERV